MQIGDPTPENNLESYNSLRQLYVNFDRESPTVVTGVLGINYRDKNTSEIKLRGASNPVALTELTPAIISAIQTITDALSAQLSA